MASANVTSAAASIRTTVDFDFTAFDNCVTFCENASLALRWADDDAMRTHRILCNQLATLISECGADLNTVSDVAEGLAGMFDAITSAAADLRWWADTVKKEYSYIEDHARGLGLIVEDGYVAIASLDDEELTDAFKELIQRAAVQAEKLSWAHDVFCSELDKLKIGIYEALIEPVFDVLKQQVMPDPNHPWLNDLTYVENLTELGATGARVYYVYRTTGQRVKVSKLFTAGWWEEFLAKELPGKWKGASGTLRVIDALEGIGRAAGPTGIVLSSVATAYDTYKEDTVKHPEWGTGHKLARAGVKTVAAGLGAAAGAALGSKLGAAAGAAVGAAFPEIIPVTAFAGQVVGGIAGGVIGGEAGEKFGDFLNEQVVDRLAEAWG